MSKSDRIKRRKNQRKLNVLDREVRDLGIIRQAFKVSQAQLYDAEHARNRWRNAAIAGVPLSLLGGLSAGLAIAHQILIGGYSFVKVVEALYR